MTRLFVANFDFEHRLGPHPLQSLNDAVARINGELAAVWVAVADDGDMLWLPGKCEQEFFARLIDFGLPTVRPIIAENQIEGSVELCPWGWTSELRDWAKRNDWSFSAPEQSVVAEANSRQFSSNLERAWGLEPRGAATIDSCDQFLSAVTLLPAGCDSWVVKANYGMSARERILGRGRQPTEAAINWVEKRLKTDGVVFLEPWVERIEEAGLQFTIPWSGPPLFEGVTTLISSESGQYQGSRFTLDVDSELRWMPAIETGMRVARELKERGYFGPLGIDALRYRDHHGNERIRSLQDLNARHTMGRLSLGFRRLLSAGEHGSWLHVTWPDETTRSAETWLENVHHQLPSEVRIVPTSPFTVNGRATRHGSLVVIASTAAELATAEQTIRMATISGM